MQNTKLIEDDFTYRHELNRLSDAINMLIPEVRKNTISQEHTYNIVQNLNSQVNKLLEKDIKREAILSLLYKVWHYSPYIIATIFFLTLAISETSFDFSKFAAILLNKYIGK